MNVRPLRFGMAVFALAFLAALCSCAPDVSGVSSWKKAQLSVAQTLPPAENELAVASELVQWSIALEGVEGKDVLALNDAQCARPAFLNVRSDNSIVRYEGVRLNDLISWLGVSEYSSVLAVSDSAQETISSDMAELQILFAWMQDGVSLTAPALIERDGVMLGNIRGLIIE